jgi:23S rRNA (cytosine1962-C5)-methyltransferase
VGATRSCSISRPLPIADRCDALALALERRAGLGARPDLDTYRLLHGSADGSPGIAADRFGEVAIVHADSSEVLGAWRSTLCEELAAIPTGYAKVHPRSAHALTEAERRRLAPDEPLWGPGVESVEAVEHGVRYLIRPAVGLSVGLFLDMREVRQWLRQPSASAGRRVLNLFAYTCSLAVCASLGGAVRVVNVDISRSYLDWGKANYALNGCAVEQRDFIYGDAFDWLGRFARRSERFEVAIVDPPSFSSSPFSVTRDFPRLVTAAARVVSPGGMLLAATNHAATTEKRFEAWLWRGLREAGRRGQIVQRWHEPSPDFPVGPHQKPYLKVRALALD